MVTSRGSQVVPQVVPSSSATGSRVRSDQVVPGPPLPSGGNHLTGTTPGSSETHRNHHAGVRP
jgi:hypothetical protein